MDARKWMDDHFIWSDKVGEVVRRIEECDDLVTGLMIYGDSSERWPSIVESLLILALNARGEDLTIYWWQDARWGPIYLVACESEDKILSECGIKEG